MRVRYGDLVFGKSSAFVRQKEVSGEAVYNGRWVPVFVHV